MKSFQQYLNEKMGGTYHINYIFDTAMIPIQSGDSILFTQFDNFVETGEYHIKADPTVIFQLIQGKPAITLQTQNENEMGNFIIGDNTGFLESEAGIQLSKFVDFNIEIKED